MFLNGRANGLETRHLVAFADCYQQPSTLLVRMFENENCENMSYIIMPYNIVIMHSPLKNL